MIGRILSILGALFAAVATLLVAGAGWLRWKWTSFRTRCAPAVIESEFVEEE